ncbi:MAG: hypothetical protein GF331_16580 [Chitinivibrionales bacterium]|nr:hypothetical protein [Chitinivibrionales bacterium]
MKRVLEDEQWTSAAKDYEFVDADDDYEDDEDFDEEEYEDDEDFDDDDEQ